MFKKVLFAIVFLGNTLLFGQTGGSLKGSITDSENGEGISFANVMLEQNGVSAARTVADIDGNFSMQGLPPGIYDLKAVCVGYQKYLMSGLIISADKATQESVKMDLQVVMMTDVLICGGSERIIYTYCCCCFFTPACYPAEWTEIDESIFSDSSEVEEKLALSEPISCKIYPNPFMDFAVLEMASESEMMNVRVSIFDMLGHEVRDIDFSGSKVVIDRGDLAAGTYQYEVISGNNSLATRRLVVQ